MVKDSAITLQGAKLTSLVKSRAFRVRLARAVRLAVKTGYEAGFCYFEDYGRSSATHHHYWSSVIEGASEEVRFSERLIEDDMCKAPWIGSVVPLLDLHIHPYTPTHDLELSAGDVENVFLRSEPFDIRTVCGIANATAEARGTILFLRSTARAQGFLGGVVEQAWSNYEQCRELWPTPAFADALEVPGFLTAGVLPYRVPLGSAHATLDDLTSLERFARLR